MLYTAIWFKLERERKKNMWFVNAKTNTNKENEIKPASLEGYNEWSLEIGPGQMGTVKGKFHRPPFHTLYT